MNTPCAPTVYIIHYREVISGGGKTDWHQIPITELNKTSYLISLKCDTEYEIAVSAKYEDKESAMSDHWRVKTKSATTGRFTFCIFFPVIFIKGKIRCHHYFMRIMNFYMQMFLLLKMFITLA